MGFGLVKRRTIWLPTWKGWLLLVILSAVVGVVVVRNIYGFLASDSRLPHADVLVVDGWVSDRIMRIAAAEFVEGRAEWVCSTGVEVNPGELFTEHSSWAELGGGTLLLLGLPEDKVLVAKAGEGQRHRTYESALAVKQITQERGISVKSLNVLTEGEHARRSGIVYRKVFGDSVELGVMAATPEGYDPDAWWTSSNGFKIVVMEVISLGYEWLADGGR